MKIIALILLSFVAACSVAAHKNVEKASVVVAMWLLFSAFSVGIYLLFFA